MTTSSNIAVRPFLLKPQRMNGLSERLLVSHYENNYGGALRRLNAIQARLATLDWAHTPLFEINGLKREELIAAGSVLLHEIYFDSLGGDGDNPPTGLAQPPAGLAKALERDFGSVMAWQAEFTTMAKALAASSCRKTQRLPPSCATWSGSISTRRRIASCCRSTRNRKSRHSTAPSPACR